MRTNNRFLLIDFKLGTISIMEDKICLAKFEFDKTFDFSDKDYLEELRLADYKTKA